MDSRSYRVEAHRARLSIGTSPVRIRLAPPMFDNKAYQKDWYQKNKVDLIRRASQRKAEFRKLVRKIIEDLKRSPCIDCGLNFPPECMDFDHVRGKKKFDVGQAARLIGRLEPLLVEIEKCELVCANCHRIRTKKRNGPIAQ